jgi:hypothetical protein
MHVDDRSEQVHQFRSFQIERFLSSSLNDSIDRSDEPNRVDDKIAVLSQPMR